MSNIRPLAIYLPQFHAIPENDKSWGNGFTEWTNVKKAKPLFEGHYQPHVPHNSLGYYDLRDPEVLIQQAAMAKEHGIFGFAFYHYWFNGKRLLETPLDNMLKTGKPDFPFCYIWANENWTRRWDGQDNEIIIKQEYSHEDDLDHIRFLCENVFSDKRYITVDGKPLFLIYRTELFPDIIRTAQLWREEAKLFGFKDVYLVRVESSASDIDPISIGFDSAMEFAPDWRMADEGIKHSGAGFDLIKYDYFSTVFKMLLKNKPYKYFRCVFPSWDNTARRKQNAIVFGNTSPDLFKYFIERAIQYTYKNFNNDEQFLFINAWNEWGEGCHIEPDELYGYQYLRLFREALNKNHSNLGEENRYVEFLEKSFGNLNKDNKLLEQKVIDLTQKINHIIKTNDYKIGQKILRPYRLLRQFLKQ